MHLPTPAGKPGDKPCVIYLNVLPRTVDETHRFNPGTGHTPKDGGIAQRSRL